MEPKTEEFYDEKDGTTKVRTTYYDIDGSVIGVVTVPKQEAIQEPEGERQPTNAELMEKLDALEGTAVERAIDDYTAELIQGGILS